VVRIAEFGAFVEIFPGTDGLLHVSEIAEHRVKEVKDELRGGRSDSGEGALDRGQPDQAVAQGRAARAAGEVGTAGTRRGRRGRRGRRNTVADRATSRRRAYAAPVEDDDEEVLVEGGEEFSSEGVDDEDGDDAPTMSRTSTAPTAFRRRRGMQADVGQAGQVVRAGRVVRAVRAEIAGRADGGGAVDGVRWPRRRVTGRSETARDIHNSAEKY